MTDEEDQNELDLIGEVEAQINGKEQHDHMADNSELVKQMIIGSGKLSFPEQLRQDSRIDLLVNQHLNKDKYIQIL